MWGYYRGVGIWGKECVGNRLGDGSGRVVVRGLGGFVGRGWEESCGGVRGGLVSGRGCVGSFVI